MILSSAFEQGYAALIIEILFQKNLTEKLQSLLLIIIFVQQRFQKIIYLDEIESKIYVVGNTVVNSLSFITTKIVIFLIPTWSARHHISIRYTSSGPMGHAR